MRKYIYPFLFIVVFPAFALAQDTEGVKVEMVDDEPIQVEVHLVNIEARVTKDGEPVKGLTKNDFILKESGKEQEIDFFYYVESPALTPVRNALAREPERATPESGQEPGVRNAEEQTAASNQESPMAPTDATWLHLVTETADPVEFKRTARAIRKFINEEMQPGFFISLGGMPFTDNKQILLNTLDRLEGKPYSRGSGIDPSLLHMKDLEIMRQIALNLPFAPDIEAIEETMQTTDFFEGPIDLAPVLGVETVNRQIRFFGSLALLRYMDLVERMALLPGRKSIVLFRSGLRLDVHLETVLDQLLSMAARNRVSFYTVDSLGLDVVSPVRDYKYALPWSRGRIENYIPNPIKEATRRREAEEGLVVLARETGGHAILDSNDLGAILSRVVQDSYSYYVIGYYPESFSNNGRFRKIDISLREDLDYSVSAVRGYAEPKKLRLQSKAERLVSLRKSLQTSTSRELNVEIEPEVFAGPDGSPVLFVSVGAPAIDFGLDKGKNESKAEGEVLIQIVNRFSQQIPLYHTGNIEESFNNEWIAKNDGPMINYQTVLPLSPGIYEIRAIIRDKRSGKFGVHSSNFVVANFRSESIPSSLLMTRYIRSIGEDAPADEGNLHRMVLSAGRNEYYPQSSPEFRRGENVHVLFHLYNPTEEDRAWAEKGLQIGIFKDEVPVSGIAAEGRADFDSEEDVIRYSVTFNTAPLSPGEYNFLALLPNYEQRKVPHLEESFQVVEVVN